MQITILERAVEKITGKSAASLRLLTLEEWRSEIEARHGKRMRFVSRFPFIGRGNIMRGKVVNHDQVEHYVDHAIRD
jgi:hypothetical protein